MAGRNNEQTSHFDMNDNDIDDNSVNISFVI